MSRRSKIYGSSVRPIDLTILRVLGGGISRHGERCGCVYCKPAVKPPEKP